MNEQETSARIRAAIEEELGGLREFADLPSTAIEEIAERLTRAIAPVVGRPAIRKSAA